MLGKSWVCGQLRGGTVGCCPMQSRAELRKRTTHEAWRPAKAAHQGVVRHGAGLFLTTCDWYYAPWLHHARQETYAG